MEVTSLLPSPAVFLLLLVLFLIYKYGTRTHGTLERLGIPVIRPLPFIGSIAFPWRCILVEEDARNAQRFGRVWGNYEGPKPQVFVADVEMAKRILIKDFEYFPDRPQLFDFEYGRDQMDMLPAERWKPLRSLLAPPLRSAVHLKAMVPTILQCTEDAFQRLDKQLQEKKLVNAKDDLFGPLVLDATAQFSFGMKVPEVANKDSKFVRSAAAFGFPASAPDTFLTILFTSFPAIGNYFAGQEIIPAMKYFISVLRGSMKERRQSGITRPDLVNILMDAIDQKVPSAEYKRLKIDEPLVVLQGAEMLMAAYDTVGTAITTTAYFITVHPDIQQRVRKEAAAVLAEGPLTYDSLNQLPLLEACVQEALRLVPILHRHFRIAVRDWEYDGVRIPAGTETIIPVTPLHRNPDVFPDPDNFDPDRWLGEDRRTLGQYHFMPFGLGPRSCIGSRLGIMECKFVLAMLLQKYRLVKAPETKMEFVSGVSLFCSTKPIMFEVEKINA